MKKINFDLKWAQTLDGQLSDDSNSSKWISSKEERIHTHKIRMNYDGILVGANTFIADLAKLTVRDIELDNNLQPARIILDPRGVVANKAINNRELLEELLDNKIRPTIILAPDNDLYKKTNIESKSLIHYEFKEDLEFKNSFQILNDCLLECNLLMENVLVEGGAKILSYFLSHKFYRNLIVSTSSKLTGGTKNRININRLLSNAIDHKIDNAVFYENDIMMFLSPVV